MPASSFCLKNWPPFKHGWLHVVLREMSNQISKESVVIVNRIEISKMSLRIVWESSVSDHLKIVK